MQALDENSVDSSSSDGRRTGATWVAATGAFLLLAAASVFVATRWSDIPDAIKLGILMMITGGCIYGGDRLRATLPATGNALFHLGVLLVPINGAAIGVHAGLDWPQLLLMNGVLATVTLAPAARHAKSVVLAAAASAGVVATCCGVAAVTDIPAPFLVALVAVAAIAGSRASRIRHLDAHALVWASAVAVAPVVAVMLAGLTTGQGVADELGVLQVAWPWSIATAALSFVVIAVCAQRRNDASLVVIAATAVLAHGIAAWSTSAAPDVINVLVVPSAFLLLELAVLAAQRDRFWAKPAHSAGVIAEAAMALPTALVPFATLFIVHRGTKPEVTIAALVGASAWIVAGVRRRDGWWASLPAAAALATFAIAGITESAAMVAGGTLVIAFTAMLLGDRARVAPSVFGITGYAVFVATFEERLALSIAVAAVAVLALAALRSTGSLNERANAVLLAVAFLAIGEAVGAPAVGAVVATITWVASCWALAIVDDAATRRVADVVRALAFAPLLLVPDLGAAELLPFTLLLAACAAVDAFRLRRVSLAYAAIAPLLVAELATSSLIGLEFANAGLALCVASSVWLGVAAITPDPWRRALAAMAGANTLTGLALAINDPAAFGPAMMVTGALVVATGLVLEHASIVHLGGVTLTVGCWMTFATNAVLVAEAYVLPVALQLIGAGLWARHHDRPAPSSWIAYGPAIALLAGAALGERVAGGSPWHSVFAGLVGVVAVVAGGSRRLVAPLVLGTATLVVVVGRESLDQAAGLPTWSWLAAGGATLIAAAVTMERRDLSPIEAGRRVVDVIGANFE
jgi:hypothetical protein